MRYLKTYKIFEDNSNKEVLDNIEDIFREIEDLGFKVEASLSKPWTKESDDEVMRIYIEKFDVYGFSQEERECKYYPTDEFVSALLHLISYVSESNLDYRIEIVDDSQVVDVVSTESEIEIICDSQCIDHLSSKSEDGLIENDVRIIGDYEAPIDYIKIVISQI